MAQKDRNIAVVHANAPPTFPDPHLHPNSTITAALLRSSRNIRQPISSNQVRNQKSGSIHSDVWAHVSKILTHDGLDEIHQFHLGHLCDVFRTVELWEIQFRTSSTEINK
jgi:hypothetical protein